MVDGNDIWEALFGIMKGDVPDAMTIGVCAQLADAVDQMSKGQQVEVPAGMKPWHGGDGPPDDWDRTKRVMYQDGGFATEEKNGAPFYWDHRQYANGFADPGNIFAYTPTPSDDTLQGRGEVQLPSRCDGKEQYAFEEWASGQRYAMDEHPLHYLFLDPRTAAARDGWAAGLAYTVAQVSAALQKDTRYDG